MLATEPELTQMSTTVRAESQRPMLGFVTTGLCLAKASDYFNKSSLIEVVNDYGGIPENIF